jgi:hypothetical protein
MAACGSPDPTPTPVPTPTPIPGFVGGEEEFAYASFVEFYKEEVDDCYWNPDDYASQTSLDEDYSGTAAYVGDGVWRFHVQIYTVYGDTYEDAEYTYEEELVEIHSLPDRTWENICTRRDYRDDYDDRYDHLVPDGPDDFDEPPEGSPWDSVRR